MAMLYIGTLEKRIDGVEKLERALEYIEGELSYHSAPLAECFVLVGQQMGGKLGEKIGNVGARAIGCPGENLSLLMREELRNELKDFLSNEEMNLFFDFVSPEGYGDMQMQKKALERSREGMKRIYGRLMEEQREKSRIALSLGVLGGLFLVILLM